MHRWDSTSCSQWVALWTTFRLWSGASIAVWCCLDERAFPGLTSTGEGGSSTELFIVYHFCCAPLILTITTHFDTYYYMSQCKRHDASLHPIHHWNTRIFPGSTFWTAQWSHGHKLQLAAAAYQTSCKVLWLSRSLWVVLHSRLAVCKSQILAVCRCTLGSRLWENIFEENMTKTQVKINKNEASSHVQCSTAVEGEKHNYYIPASAPGLSGTALGEAGVEIVAHKGLHTCLSVCRLSFRFPLLSRHAGAGRELD